MLFASAAILNYLSLQIDDAKLSEPLRERLDDAARLVLDANNGESLGPLRNGATPYRRCPNAACKLSVRPHQAGATPRHAHA
jgi:hypothetical protein